MHLQLLLSLFILPTLVAPARPYPLFRQCDSRWGANEMGVAGAGERSTVCGEGCAITCLAMVLNELQVPYPGAPTLINPGSLNMWLIASKFGARASAQKLHPQTHTP